MDEASGSHPLRLPARVPRAQASFRNAGATRGTRHLIPRASRTLVIRVGLLARLLLIVPVGEIAEILPGDGRIVLHRSPRPTATERLQDRRERVQPGGRRRAPNHEVAGAGAGATRIEARKEVEAMIGRLTRRIGLRFGRGGEREMTPDAE